MTKVSDKSCTAYNFLQKGVQYVRLEADFKLRQPPPSAPIKKNFENATMLSNWYYSLFPSYEKKIVERVGYSILANEYIPKEVNLKYERNRFFSDFITLYHFSSLKLDFRLMYCTP